MYNRRMLERAHKEIEAQIRRMPRVKNCTSLDFYTGFQENHSTLYEEFIRMYMDRDSTVDRPHAEQVVHAQLMHTVNHCFHHLIRKVRTIPNPKGGNQSEWIRL